MAQINSTDKIKDPVDALNECLECAWSTLCETYDASACLPNIVVLFDQVKFANPQQAAEAVLVNMLLEVIECICRFSPWYSKPARIFGLNSVRDTVTNRMYWVLAPEAAQKWAGLLDPLSNLIMKYSGLINALLLGERWGGSEDDDPNVTACCGCIPPRVIQVRRSILIKEKIICDRCLQKYS
jgi:hypothetical protein